MLTCVDASLLGDGCQVGTARSTLSMQLGQEQWPWVQTAEPCRIVAACLSNTGLASGTDCDRLPHFRHVLPPPAATHAGGHCPKRCSIIARAVQRLPLFPCLCCQSPCTKAWPLLRIAQEVCTRRSPSAGGERAFHARPRVSTMIRHQALDGAITSPPRKKACISAHNRGRSGDILAPWCTACAALAPLLRSHADVMRACSDDMHPSSAVAPGRLFGALHIRHFRSLALQEHPPSCPACGGDVSAQERGGGAAAALVRCRMPSREVYDGERRRQPEVLRSEFSR